MSPGGPYTVPGNIERAVMALESSVKKVGTDPVVMDPVFASDLRLILAERRRLREACGEARTAFDRYAEMHYAKDPPDRVKAAANLTLAEHMARAMDLSHL